MCGKDVDPLPLSPNLRQQKLSSRHIHDHGVAPCTNDCFCTRRLVSMYTSALVLGYYDSGEMHRFSGFRICSGGTQYPGGFNHNVPAHNGAEVSEAGLEEEICVGIHVRSRVFVSLSSAAKEQTC
jgi:hypothetical protein